MRTLTLMLALPRTASTPIIQLATTNIRNKIPALPQISPIQTVANGWRAQCTTIHNPSLSTPVSSKQPKAVQFTRDKMITPNDKLMIFSGDRLLRNVKSGEFIVDARDVVKDPGSFPKTNDFFCIGEYEGTNLFATASKEPAIENSPDFNFVPLRDALLMTDKDIAQVISKGKQLFHWHRTSLFSGCCGTPTQMSETEMAKVCQECHKTIYPMTSPVVIVLIKDGDKVLLARSPNFAPGMFSTLAGFMEPGESCEQAIRREVEEEVGVKLGNISYYGSQAWPFPSSLMIGYIAQYAGGDVIIDKKEIEEAKWFDRSNLPPLPHPYSIARHMIDQYVNQID